MSKATTSASYALLEVDSTSNNKRLPRCIKTLVPLTDGQIEVYAGQKVAAALKTLSALDLFDGAKVTDLISAVYEQGKKDGARSVFEHLDVLKEQVPHRNPGQPKKKRKAKRR